MEEQTKYTLGATAFFAFAFIEAGDGCIFWSLLLFTGCVGCMWHALNLWMEANEAKWQARRKREVQAIYHATVYPDEE